MGWTGNNPFLGLRLRPALGALVVALRMLSGVEACAASLDTAWKPPVFTRLDSLFITAATGEPRFEKERDSSRKALLALDTAAFQYLLDHRLTRQTPRQRHYVETLFMLASDSGRNPRPRLWLARALSAKPDSLRAQLLYIGSEMRDTAFRREAVPYLRADSESVRRMAVRCLGSYPNPGNVPLLWEGLEKTGGLELQQRLWSLEAQGSLGDWKRLVPLLGDSLFFNRRKVRDMLLRAADSSWAALSTAMPKNPDSATRREWRLLAAEAKGGKEFLEAEKAEMTPEEKRFFGM